MTVKTREADAPQTARNESTEAVAPAAAPRSSRRGMRRWFIAAGIVTAGAATAFLAINTTVRERVRGVAVSAWSSIAGGHEAPAEAHAPSSPVPHAPWRGVIELDQSQLKSLGIELVEAKLQTDPMRLYVNGRTDYDPNTLSKIRPKFKSKIDKVYVQYGRSVQKGDPLVDLFSADLAEAKGQYETKMAQWEHDRAELARSAELRKSGAESEKIYLSVLNDEKKSGTEAKIAKDKLMVFGLSEAEIANVMKEEGEQKAKMTLRSPSSGVVIGRDVVQGNLYDENDVLLTIAPLDHFWVYGYVYPSDASRVSLGLSWVVDCPFVGQQHRRTIESITSEIDKETKTLRIQTRIDNSAGKLKADMLVGGWIEIPPPDVAKRMVIPRLAMVSADGADYVFVLKSGADAKDGKLQFERRTIRVIHEGSNSVFVAEGTRPGEGLNEGERVVTNGSLLMMQMYEDAASVESGTPQ